MPKLDPLLTHLEALYREVVRAVTGGSAAQWGELGRNAKGDQVKWFDLAADQAVCAYLERHFPSPVRLLSEEGAPRDFRVGEPEWIMVLDPVDGSENFARGLNPAAMAIALIPAGLPVALETVELALVGDLYSDHTWQAARGKGAFSQGKRLQASPIIRLDRATISCDLGRTIIQSPLIHLLAQAHGVRAFGSATTVLARVADGSLDAHLDVRGCLTPENFLAPALIITEAGGLITNDEGVALPPIQSLTECYSVVAAGAPELHAALLQYLVGTT
ncbi:MAG TPA: inositol monophosphatase family protein [Anaerolineae bacterium]|nr:inositol monophosphatase family protein [Anaerolineae bacterium]